MVEGLELSPQFFEEWNRLFQASKFSQLSGFAVQPRGHIVLQDHGNPVWFRNLKIRPLNP